MVSNLIEDRALNVSFAGPSSLLNLPEASVRDTAPRWAGVPFKRNSSVDMVVGGDDPKIICEDKSGVSFFAVES
jgi:hypothetical protein